MPFLLQLRLYVLLAHGAVLHELGGVLLPRLAHFILLVEADGTHPISGIRAENGEDGAFPSRHIGRRVMVFLGRSKANKRKKKWKVESYQVESIFARIERFEERSLLSTYHLPLRTYDLPCRNANTPETATAPSPAAVTNWAK